MEKVDPIVNFDTTSTNSFVAMLSTKLGSVDLTLKDKFIQANITKILDSMDGEEKEYLKKLDKSQYTQMLKKLFKTQSVQKVRIVQNLCENILEALQRRAAYFTCYLNFHSCDLFNMISTLVQCQFTTNSYCLINSFKILLIFLIKYAEKVQISNTIIPIFYIVAMHVILTPVNKKKNYQQEKKRNVLT